MMTSCPICACECTGTPLNVYTVGQAASHFCPPWRDADRHRRLVANIRSLWQGDECRIRRCGACGFAFGDPFVGGDEEFYSILHESSGYPNWRWDYDAALELALRPAGGGRILDVGAGDGRFLTSLDSQWECWAAEGSEAMRTVLEARGIRVVRDLAHIAQQEHATFSVATMFQVLEHIAEFRPLLAQCRQLLRPGGRLVITVPDCDAMLRQPELNGEHDMPPNHINKFTPRSLARLLEEFGFVASAARYEPPSWSKAFRSAYGRVRADATDSRTLSAKIYRVRNKRVRAPLLAGAGMLALPRLLPHLRELRLGGSFAMLGTVPAD